MKNHDDFSPEQLEQHIQHCENFMSDAMARYELSGSFEDRGDADGWRVAMECAIAARGPAVVAAMEVERGIA